MQYCICDFALVLYVEIDRVVGGRYGAFSGLLDCLHEMEGHSREERTVDGSTHSWEEM